MSFMESYINRNDDDDDDDDDEVVNWFTNLMKVL